MNMPMRPTVVSFRRISTFGTVYMEHVSVRSHPLQDRPLLHRRLVCTLCLCASGPEVMHPRCLVDSILWLSPRFFSERTNCLSNIKLYHGSRSLVWNLDGAGCLSGFAAQMRARPYFRGLGGSKKVHQNHTCTFTAFVAKVPSGRKKSSEKWTNCTFTSFC